MTGTAHPSTRKPQFNIKKLTEAIEGVKYKIDIVLGTYSSECLAKREACPKVYDIKKDLHRKVFLENIVVLNDFGIVEHKNKTRFHDRLEINNARVLLGSYVESIGDNSGNYEGIIRFMFNDDVKNRIENYIVGLQNSLIKNKHGGGNILFAGGFAKWRPSNGEGAGALGGN